jgi:hypothetical protein
MKIKVDEEDIYELSEIRMKVIANDINSDKLDEDLKRRIKYIIQHKYERCLKRLKEEWVPKLKEKNLEFIPLDDDALAILIFSQEDYKDKLARDLELEKER